jgi:hypothetical protein
MTRKRTKNKIVIPAKALLRREPGSIHPHAQTATVLREAGLYR